MVNLLNIPKDITTQVVRTHAMVFRTTNKAAVAAFLAGYFAFVANHILVAVCSYILPALPESINWPSVVPGVVTDVVDFVGSNIARLYNAVREYFISKNSLDGGVSSPLFVSSVIAAVVAIASMWFSNLNLALLHVLPKMLGLE